MIAGIFTLALSLAFAFHTIYYASASPKANRRESKPHTSETSPTAAEKQPEIDISTLSGKKICWGQGVNFDTLNRPRDAVTSQQKYGALGGFFVDLADADASAEAQPESKKIYLTFDEGYENGYTEKILDTLKEKKVKAVFFITGDYAKREGELVMRMINEGQTVGNHTWRHCRKNRRKSVGKR